MRRLDLLLTPAQRRVTHLRLGESGRHLETGFLRRYRGCRVLELGGVSLKGLRIAATRHVAGVVLRRREAGVVRGTGGLLGDLVHARSHVTATDTNTGGVAESRGVEGGRRVGDLSSIRGDGQRLTVKEVFRLPGGPVLLGGGLIKSGDDRRASGDAGNRMLALPTVALTVGGVGSITEPTAGAGTEPNGGAVVVAAGGEGLRCLGGGGRLDAVEVDAPSARVGPGFTRGLGALLVPQLSAGEPSVGIIHLGDALGGDRVGVGDAGRPLGRTGTPIDIGAAQLEVDEEQEGSYEHEDTAQNQSPVEVPGRLHLALPADGQAGSRSLAVGHGHDDDLLVEVLVRQHGAVGVLAGVEGD